MSPPAVFQLFLSFLRLGLTAFGGPAMIAHIRELSVNKNNWLDEGRFSVCCSMSLLIKFILAVPWDILRVLLGMVVLTVLIKKIDLLYIVLIGGMVSVWLFSSPAPLLSP